MPIEKPDHRARARRLEQRVFDEPADTSVELRRQMGERAAGGAPVAPPYDALARDVGEASYRVTDAEVSAVRTAAGSDRAAFELVAAAAVGAALKRWKAGIAAIDEATK
jgi:hypothetical protein